MKMQDQERKIKKVYGDRQVEKMRTDFKRDVTDLTVLEQKMILKNYEESINLLKRSKIEVQELREKLTDYIPHEISKAKTALQTT